MRENFAFGDGVELGVPAFKVVVGTEGTTKDKPGCWGPLLVVHPGSGDILDEGLEGSVVDPERCGDLVSREEWQGEETLQKLVGGTLLVERPL